MKIRERDGLGFPKEVELDEAEIVVIEVYRELREVGFSLLEAADMTFTIAVQSKVPLDRDLIQWMTEELEPNLSALVAMYEEMVRNA